MIRESFPWDFGRTAQEYMEKIEIKDTQYLIVQHRDRQHPYHRSSLPAEWLAQHPRIRQKFLPPYSPNLNLIERLWKWMKKKVTATVYYPTFAEFK